jgi:hypothetical protein
MEVKSSFISLFQKCRGEKGGKRVRESQGRIERVKAPSKKWGRGKGNFGKNFDKIGGLWSIQPRISRY